ncbi:MAG: hypothetical protein MJY57_06120, partial [Bacteroidales bacterium]|nr:hypothetical protein [Bacteroidales bacterium]
MKKGFFTVILSVVLSGLTAYGILKAANPEELRAAQTAVGGSDARVARTVNLSLSDYPDFTYAAEHAVEAVVYVKVTLKSKQQQMISDPFFRFFFGEDPQ